MRISWATTRPRCERIAVIGSGIAGCLIAVMLAEHDYEVEIFEQGRELFNGTSRRAIQMHLGGMYGGSPETARDCLRSAIEFKKLLPHSVTAQKTRFLVAEQSKTPWSEYLKFYNGLKEYYAELDASDQVFGEPGHFFRVLKPHEYDFAKGVVGGITTQEPGLAMYAVKTDVLSRFNRLGIHTTTDAEVIQASQRRGMFKLRIKSDGGESVRYYDQVVNAAGYKAGVLDSQLGSNVVYNLYLKTWNVMRLEAGCEPLPPFYVVQGDFIHYAPLEQSEYVCLIASQNKASFIDTLAYDSSNTHLPPEWEAILRSGAVPDESARQQTILRFATDNFIKEPHLIPIAMIPGVAVSFHGDRNHRLQRGVVEVVSGWQTAVPTKVTHAARLARQVLAGALRHSGRLQP